MEVHSCTFTPLIQARATTLMEWLVIAGPLVHKISPCWEGSWHGQQALTPSAFSGADSGGSTTPARGPCSLYSPPRTQQGNSSHSPQVREVDLHAVCANLSTPVLLDAAPVGSRVHCLRSFWQNLVAPRTLEQALATFLRKPGIEVDSLLDPAPPPWRVVTLHPTTLLM